jgi:hypothetical protein
MARYKPENKNRFRMTECIKCGKPVSDRQSYAVGNFDPKAEATATLAKDERGNIITRKALPRAHRDKCPA